MIWNQIQVWASQVHMSPVQCVISIGLVLLIFGVVLWLRRR